MKVAFIKNFCEHCRRVIVPIEEINLELPIGKRVNTINCSDWENFGIKGSPIMDNIKFEGYPHIFLDGIEVQNIISKKMLKSFFDGYFERDKIIN